MINNSITSNLSSKYRTITRNNNQVAFTGLASLMQKEIKMSKADLFNYLGKAESLIGGKGIQDDLLIHKFKSQIEEKLGKSISRFSEMAAEEKTKILNTLKEVVPDEVVLGKRDTIVGKLVNSIFKPVIALYKFVKKMVKKIASIGKNPLEKVINDYSNNKIVDEATILKTYKKKLVAFAEDKGLVSKELTDLEQKFKLAEGVLGNSDKYDIAIKAKKIAEATKKDQNRFKDYVLYIKSRGDKLDEKDLVKKVTSGLSYSGQQYDSSLCGTINRFIGGFATLYFLCNDAWVQSMIRSRGDEKVSGDARNKRISQEIARIAFSTYLININNSFFSKLFNSSLAGVGIVTGMNVLLSETLARKSVGTPIFPKSREELIRIEEENKKSTNSVKRFIGKLMGKKSISAQAAQKLESNAPAAPATAVATANPFQPQGPASTSQNLADPNKPYEQFMKK